MDFIIKGEDAKTVLKLLQHIEDGYIPTEEELQDMNDSPNPPAMLGRME